MNDAHAEVNKHVKIYIAVFAALACFTIITVAASRVDLGAGVNVGVALLIAAFKASLVAAIFMHLKWEKSISIWWMLGICGLFLVVLMLVPVLTSIDTPPGVTKGIWD